ncbi:MAG: cytochrome C [Planctomycetota bacterium]|nr:MAG: cytochrome C [Planctomycetota bacterium]
MRSLGSFECLQTMHSLTEPAMKHRLSSIPSQWPFLTCVAVLFVALQLTADDKPDDDSAENDYSAELPAIPAMSPEESLAAMQLIDGFHAELVASEPLIRSPMGMDFDEYGRAFVVELPEYNQYASPEPHGTGAVKLLEDSDNDGRFDKATVYVEDLNYPTAVACWNGGILVGVAPDILFCKDTDGDGKADVRETLFTGFGQDKAGEGMLNSFRWRIDNRFHIPTGLDGGEIVPAGETGEAPPDPINARGQHLLLDPLTMQLTAASGGGQHGMSFDDWTLHGFVCGNSEPVHLLMYDGRYIARNPYLEAPAAAINIAPQGKYTTLMRISEVEPWRILRTRLRSKGLIPGSDEGGKASGFFTGATGITVYRGDAWPDEYKGQLFVGEVANNLVYRARLEPNGVGLTAHRADPKQEFLATTDNWTRPVQFANAPDGTLYLIDMYRQLIEGAAFLAPPILKHMDPAAGSDMGRIYRIAPDGFEFEPPPRLGDLDSAELVAFYEHENAWHRDTASRLIYQRQDRAAVAPLRSLVKESESPLARVMGLYSLQGLSALEPSMILPALQSNDPRERQHALRLAESFSNEPTIRQAVLPLADDPDLRVRYQAAFTLGEFDGEQATAALARIAVRDGADPWMQLAVLSSIGNRRGEFLALLLQDRDARRTAHVKSLLKILSTQLGAANRQDDLALFIRQIDALSSQPDGKALAEELVKNVVSKQPAVSELLSGAAGGKAQEILAAMIRDARDAAGDAELAAEARATAVRTLATADFEKVDDLFEELLQSQQPQPVQLAALETLAQFDNPGVPALILESWPSQTPQLRATSIETLFARPDWINAFLDAVEDKSIASADLDPARIALLKEHRNEDIRDRARELFAGTALARRQEIVDAYQQALELQGDADRGRTHFRKTCATCHKLEGFGESIGADLKAIRDRGLEAVMLNILDPNREVKPQFHSYVILLESGRTLTGMITAESANSLTIRKPDNTTDTILRVDIEELQSTGLSFMPEGLEKQLDHQAMADLLAYLNSIE